MPKLSTCLVNACEQGNIQILQALPRKNRVNYFPSRSIIKGSIIIILFNMCLLYLGYLAYKYLNTLQDEQKLQISNYLCSLGAFVVIISLLRNSDMSKNNPYFYYI
ncbi:uncharacterized protein Dvir_GJ27028, isoform A [Drosophila virilis]|uniref:Uncharacterized protein, isoform A n=1 Tax=Drosophila virilis TaxID=7244 RepID=A0A0Q9WQT9_DROVI|nr:uncharacterized protein LOC26531798 [Drosophila virilis]KRF83327.1 uncharacterized protein Dvir_GJ27028, isoform A [Drosophila virilis]